MVKTSVLIASLWLLTASVWGDMVRWKDGKVSHRVVVAKVKIAENGRALCYLTSGPQVTSPGWYGEFAEIEIDRKVAAPSEASIKAAKDAWFTSVTKGLTVRQPTEASQPALERIAPRRKRTPEAEISDATPDGLYYYFARRVFGTNKAGLTMLQQDNLWETKYKGKRVSWAGKIREIRHALLGDEVVVFVECGTRKVNAKVVFDKALAPKLLQLNKGDRIQFRGILADFGGLDNDFEIKNAVLLR